MVSFRSDIMCHGTVVLPVDVAFDVVASLARAGLLIEYEDATPHLMTRPFRRNLQRVEDAARIVGELYGLLESVPGLEIVKGDEEAFLDRLDDYDLETVESEVSRYGRRLAEFRGNNDDLELKLRTSELALRVVEVAAAESPDWSGSVHDLGFRCVAGVCRRSLQGRLSTAIFRASRGNAFVAFVDVDEPAEPPQHSRFRRKRQVFDPQAVCYTYCQDGDLVAVVERVFGAFSVERYYWPHSRGEAEAMIRQLSEEIASHHAAIDNFHQVSLREYKDLVAVPFDDGSSLIEEWARCLRVWRVLYASLNCFEPVKDVLRTSCFWPESSSAAFESAVDDFNRQTGASVVLVKHAKLPAKPPTYFRTVEFTRAFQTFVDTYGVARYREANPAYLTCVSFPFLFGVMYGDIGHGMFLLAAGLLSCIFADRLGRKDGFAASLREARFMLLLMGFFSVFAGFLYNDYFSLGVDIFGSRYRSVEFGQLPGLGTGHGESHEFEPCQRRLCGGSPCSECPSFPYPFGLDPIWKGAENELLFLNSVKMKFAIVVAWVQMSVGIITKGSNAIHFRDWLSFIFEVIPQIIFFWGLIGWMAFLILFKWATDPFDFHAATCDGSEPPNTQCDLPNIITAMLDMLMMKKTGPFFFSGQSTFQTILVFLVLAMVPIMLLPKPFILRFQHAHRRSSAVTEVAVEEGLTHDDEEDEEPFNFGEEFIHQMIETIEFVLGAVSNTASYLRLWALSLAHQQLALVFYDQTLGNALQMHINGLLKGFVLFFLFAAFAAVTTGVMLMMDTLECFLHALRLQWVEFQNKFYKGDGVAFAPLLLVPVVKGIVES